MQILNLFHSKSYECQNSYLVWYLFRVFFLFVQLFQESNREMTNSNLISFIHSAFPSFFPHFFLFGLHVGFVCLFLSYIFSKCQCIVTEWKKTKKKGIRIVEKSRFGLFYNFPCWVCVCFHFKFVCLLEMNVCFRQQNPISSCCFLSQKWMCKWWPIYKSAHTHTPVSNKRNIWWNVLERHLRQKKRQLKLYEKKTHESGCFTQNKAVIATTKGSDLEQYT